MAAGRSPSRSSRKAGVAGVIATGLFVLAVLVFLLSLPLALHAAPLKKAQPKSVIFQNERFSLVRLYLTPCQVEAAKVPGVELYRATIWYFGGMGDVVEACWTSDGESVLFTRDGEKVHQVPLTQFRPERKA